MRKHWYSIKYIKFDINSLLLEILTPKLSETLSNYSLTMSDNKYITNSEIVTYLHSNFERLCIPILANYSNIYKQETLPNNIISVIKTKNSSNINKFYHKTYVKMIMNELSKELKNIDNGQRKSVIFIRGQ